jgi:hypothetical protein
MAAHGERGDPRDLEGGTVRMRADGPTTADAAQRIVEFFTRSLATR